MRGADRFTESLFTVAKREDFIPADHPLRPIRQVMVRGLAKVDQVVTLTMAAYKLTRIRTLARGCPWDGEWTGIRGNAPMQNAKLQSRRGLPAFFQFGRPR